MTIRDNVEAVHRLLTEELKVTHLRAMIGFSMGARAGLPMGRELPGFRRPHRRHFRHGEDAIRTEWCAWKDRSPRSRPMPRSRAAITRLRPAKGWRRSAWCGRHGSTRRNGGAGSCGAANCPPGTTFEQALNRFRTRFSADANDYDSASAHVGAARRGNDAGIRWRRGARAALDQGSAAVHAVGNGSVFPGRRRAL